MSKVLVDRELLERIVNTNMADYAVIAYQHKEIRFILEAQPAEAEGVVPVVCYLRAFQDGTPHWTEDCVCEDAVYPNHDDDETYSMPMVRQSDHLAALSAVTAERDRLESMLIRTTTRHFAQQWKDRADDKKLDECLSEGIAMLEAERDRLRAVLEGAQYPNIDRLKTLTIERCRQVGETVMRLTIDAQSERDQLRAEVEGLRKDADRWRYVRLQGDDTHWLNLLRVDLEDFGGNINAAVDALIDGDTPNPTRSRR